MSRKLEEMAEKFQDQISASMVLSLHTEGSRREPSSPPNTGDPLARVYHPSALAAPVPFVVTHTDGPKSGASASTGISKEPSPTLPCFPDARIAAAPVARDYPVQGPSPLKLTKKDRLSICSTSKDVGLANALLAGIHETLGSFCQTRPLPEIQNDPTLKQLESVGEKTLETLTEISTRWKEVEDTAEHVLDELMKHGSVLPEAKGVGCVFILAKDGVCLNLFKLGARLLSTTAAPDGRRWAPFDRGKYGWNSSSGDRSCAFENLSVVSCQWR